MGFRKFSAALCAAAAAVVAVAGAPVQAEAADELPAVFATGGSGRYRESIQWLQWADYTQFAGKEKPNVPVLDKGQSKDFVNYRDLGDAGRLVTTCTLGNLKHLGHGDHLDNPDAGGAYPLTDEQAYGPLVATIPGAWAGDALDNLYNVGGAAQWKDGSEVWKAGLTYPTDYTNKNQMVIGLANGYAYNGAKTWNDKYWPEAGADHRPTGYNSRVSVDYSCKAELRSADGSVREVPISGLVFADAEASSKRSGTPDPTTQKMRGEYSDEWVQASTTQPVTWRLLDRLRSEGCPTTTNAQFMSGNTLRLMPSGEECVYQNGGKYSQPNGLGGPDAVMFMEGATSATVTIQGSGYSAVALGLIVATDFGDAPKSYGVASSLFQPTWNGGQVSGNADLFTVDQARMSMNSGSPHLGDAVDAEGVQEFSSDALGDDNNDRWTDDEDGVDLPADGIRTAPGGRYQQIVKCAGQGKIAGWIDWNHNDRFDANEKSDEVSCAGNRANLTWSVPTDVVRSVDGEQDSKGDTFMRVRITADQGALSATGNTATGEVEDYKVAVRVPTIQLIKTVNGAHASTQVPALDATQWEVSAAFDGIVIHGAGTTGAPRVTSAGEFNLAELSNNQDAVGYAAGNWTCRQTPGTLGENHSSFVGATDEMGQAVLTIRNQDRVTCTLENSTKPGSLEWNKVDVDGNKLGGSQWTLTGPDVPQGTVVTDCISAPCSAGAYADQDPAEGVFKLKDLKWGDYTITESRAPAGYIGATDSFSFEQINPRHLTAKLAYGPQVHDGGVVNERATGAVTWRKTDADNGEALAGSVWTLTDPDGRRTEITDCTEGTCAGTGLRDEDPTPGSFRVNGLAWNQDRDYTLVESKAPAGYQRSNEVHSFRIQVDQHTGKVIDHDFTEAFTNQKAAVPPIPLTGGTGADTFLIAGGALGALAGGLQIMRRRRAQKN